MFQKNLALHCFFPIFLHYADSCIIAFLNFNCFFKFFNMMQTSGLVINWSLITQLLKHIYMVSQEQLYFFEAHCTYKNDPISKISSLVSRKWAVGGQRFVQYIGNRYVMVRTVYFGWICMYEYFIQKTFLLACTQCQWFDCFYRAKIYGHPCMIRSAVYGSSISDNNNFG